MNIYKKKFFLCNIQEKAGVAHIEKQIYDQRQRMDVSDNGLVNMRKRPIEAPTRRVEKSPSECDILRSSVGER